jgi:predicted RNA binding protein YcfA (HicA-like mRNA interferase family)
MVKKVKEMIDLIESDGWVIVGQKGSHRQFKYPAKKGKVTIDGKLSDDIGDFLIKSIKKQAELL